MNQNLINAIDVTITRNKTCLLEHASFTIDKGQIIWLTGESGSGKTSFAECLSGSLYYLGTIRFNWDFTSAFAPKVAYVTQFSQFKNKSGMSEFYYQQRFNSYDSEATINVAEVISELAINQTIADNINSLVNLFNFEHKLSNSLLQLSSGERKKLQLIKALANPPQIVILDNPLTGLDKFSMTKLEEYITKLTQDGITFIIIERLNYIFAGCNKVMLLHNKQLVIEDKLTYLAKFSNNKLNEFLPIKLALLDVVTKYNDIVLFNNVSIKYGSKLILQNINWRVGAGEKWLIQGENGAGKSTLLSLITGDNPQAYANDIWLFDKKRGSGETIWDIKAKIGYISPELQWNFAVNLTCLEIVLSGYFDTPGLYSRATIEQINYARNLLSMVNLAQYTDCNYAKLSNGVQRCILLIRALVKQPPLLVFDEPCQGMSESQSEFFVNLIDSLFHNLRHTIIYVTHRSDEIPKCLTKGLIMHNGKTIIEEII